ncbi:hypothetical protein K456DRAFT_1120890 [Colletotrichum gloeosporioides 23]|nr:hypothetical protein K456DRAFT_1120890 [Colletotrichum gloeosporioides 23]
MCSRLDLGGVRRRPWESLVPWPREIKCLPSSLGLGSSSVRAARDDGRKGWRGFPSPASAGRNRRCLGFWWAGWGWMGGGETEKERLRLRSELLFPYRNGLFCSVQSAGLILLSKRTNGGVS